MLISGVQGKSTFLLADHETSCCSTCNEHISRQKVDHDLQLLALLKLLPDDEDGNNYPRKIIARGGSTGIWLSTI